MFKLVSLFLLIVSGDIALHAQQSDSLRQQKTDSAMNNPVVPGLQSPDLTERLEFTDENSVPVLTTEVAPALAKTLQQEEYRGWENGKLFRHISTNEYKLEMIDDPYIRVFYFDKDGQRIIE